MILESFRKTEFLCPLYRTVRRSELGSDDKNLLPSVKGELKSRILKGSSSLAVRILCNKMVQKHLALTFCCEIIGKEGMLILSMLEAIIMISRTMKMRDDSVNDRERA